MTQTHVSDTFAFACSKPEWWELVRSGADPLVDALSPEDARAFEAARDHVVASAEALLHTCWQRLRETAPTNTTRFQYFHKNRFQGVRARRSAYCWHDLCRIAAKKSWVYLQLEPDWDNAGVRLYCYIDSAPENIDGFARAVGRKTTLGRRSEDRWWYVAEVEVKKGASFAEMAQSLQEQAWPRLRAYSEYLTPGNGKKAGAA